MSKVESSFKKFIASDLPPLKPEKANKFKKAASVVMH